MLYSIKTVKKNRKYDSLDEYAIMKSDHHPQNDNFLRHSGVEVYRSNRIVDFYINIPN